MGGVAIEGVDYAFLPQHPSIPGLAEAGKQFACRYLGPGTSDKHLTPDEANELEANGIAIVANAEGSANGLLGGWKTGFAWAARAADQAHDCGMPDDRPIYLSIDFDVTSSQWEWYVRDALRGAADALGGVHRVGVYGSVRAVEWARRDGVAAWFWQTYAWSAGRWASGNHIEQYRNGVDLAGGKVDLDRALSIDYGQWRGKPMGIENDVHAWVQAWRIAALTTGAEHVQGGPLGPGTEGGGVLGEPMWVVSALKRIEAKLDSLTVGGVDVGELAEALRPVTDDVMRHVLLDGVRPR